jgi:site-specific recombinase XerD
VLPEQQALVALDAAMDQTKLTSPSRSNYRGYLRRLYRFALQEGLDLSDNADQSLWPSAPSNDGVSRRAQVAYDRFVRWAIGRSVWPTNVRAKDVLDWSLHEKSQSNQHWRKDYERLQAAWNASTGKGTLPGIEFLPLPPKLNGKYALPLEQWPGHLLHEWQRMCNDASVPLRKGGMRPWRDVTRQLYESRLTLFLGWFGSQGSATDVSGETWASLLSADRCRDYLNWLVVRSGKKCLNPSHTAFLRMVRGFHRFLLGSPHTTIDQFKDLCARCEVEGRDKASRMVRYSTLLQAWQDLLGRVMKAMRSGRSGSDAATLASRQVNVLILGLLATRALRRLNIVTIRLGTNLVRTEDGFVLRFTGDEMKGHRRFETTVPDELTPILEDYLRRGYRALSGRQPADGDLLLLSRNGTPFELGSLGQKVKRLTKRLIGKRVNPHLFRHIVATHAAQVWKMTPTELAAFLDHKSVLTVMKYYEVTSPTQAARRMDELRPNGDSTA